MRGKKVLSGVLLFAALCMAVLSSGPRECLAQFSRFSVRGAYGAGYMPLGEWKDFWEEKEDSRFIKDRFGSYWELDVSFYIAERHSIVLSLESIRTSSSLFGAIIYTDTVGDTVGAAGTEHEWDIKAMPIGLSYEYHPALPYENVSPFLGVGVSLFISEVATELSQIYSTLYEFPGEEDTRDGKGYGFHAYIGLESQITEHMFIVSRLRGRYADGMGFTDDEGDVKVEFTGFDFTLGAGWRF